MALISDGAVVEDRWVRIDDDAPLPAAPAVVSLRRWLAERESLAECDRPHGILLQGGDDCAAIAGDMPRFGLICVAFPAFTDGRAYSLARKLRERHGYTGELRAVGNILRDQLFFMRRCGFDAFEIPGESVEALEDWLRAMNEISVVYQRAADRRNPAWVRRQG